MVESYGYCRMRSADAAFQPNYFELIGVGPQKTPLASKQNLLRLKQYHPAQLRDSSMRQRFDIKQLRIAQLQNAQRAAVYGRTNCVLLYRTTTRYNTRDSRRSLFLCFPPTKPVGTQGGGIADSGNTSCGITDFSPAIVSKSMKIWRKGPTDSAIVYMEEPVETIPPPNKPARETEQSELRFPQHCSGGF